MDAAPKFQSSPGPRGPGVASFAASSPNAIAVSILARPSRAGRLPRAWLPRPPGLMFQSSPGPRGPGVRGPAGVPAEKKSFNPRPALAGRASGRKPSRTSPTMQFSILARPSRAGRHTCAVACANSLTRAVVSILARPSRAGRPPWSRRPRTAASPFQSSPGPRGPGVGTRPPLLPHQLRFNPRPALAGRASASWTAPRRSSRCFNPRPALAGRASAVEFPLAAVTQLFQSSPGPRGPGVSPAHSMQRRQVCFNPRPALAGRASILALGGRSAVSILARPSRAGRRVSNCQLPAYLSARFQSSLGPRGPGVIGWPVSVRASPLLLFQSSPGPRGPGVEWH